MTLEDMSVRVGGGAAFVGSAFGGGVVAGMDAIDYWPDASTQRTVVVGDDGQVYKDDGAGGSWATLLAAALTTAGMVPHLVEGGAEAAGNNKKLFLFTRVNSVRVLPADAAAMTVISDPPVDWSGSNQPGGGCLHQGYLWAFGNANAPHTVYRSLQANHENFTTSAYSLRVFPGEGDRLVAGVSYKGVLLLWKDGRNGGVYAVDTSDSNDANWRVIKVGSAGAAGRASDSAMNRASTPMAKAHR